MIRKFLFFVLTASIAGHAAADAYPAKGSGMPLRGFAKPIQAWEVFCATPRYALECAVDQKEPDTITLTPEIWSQIVFINRLVNRRIRGRSDLTHYGQQDVWDLAEDGYGDCEDIQLLKRHRLVELGLPRGAMRMTVVRDEIGTGHAVLTLITDRGDFVLDNKTSAVLPWRQSRYTFLKRERQDAQSWVRIGPQPALEYRQMVPFVMSDRGSIGSARISTVK